MTLKAVSRLQAVTVHRIAILAVRGVRGFKMTSRAIDF